MNINYEYELKLLIEDKHNFERLLLWDGAEFGRWEANFSFNRSSIFLDTDESIFNKKDISIALVLRAGFDKQENRLLLKVPLADNTNIRKEYLIQLNGINASNIKDLFAHSEVESLLIKYADGDDISTLAPIVIINQDRHKRGLFIDGQKIYLSSSTMLSFRTRILAS